MANDEHLRRAFSYFDKDGNGFIEAEELHQALAEDGASDSMDVAKDILQEVDTDKVYLFSHVHRCQIPSPSPTSQVFCDRRTEKSATMNLWR